LHLVVFFVCAVHLHTALARRRPDTRHLTEFYLWLACGGVLGGLFNTFVAPLAFTGIVEYPAAIVAACLVRPWPEGTTLRRLVRADVIVPLVLGSLAVALALALQAQMMSWSLFLGGLTLLVLGCFSCSRRPVRFGLAIAVVLIATQLVSPDGQTVLLAERTFFGVLRVRTDAGNNRILMHGSTVHGVQSLDPARRHEPLTYYHRSGPMGQLMNALGSRLAAADIGVVGLGAGSLAAYVKPGQRWTFYEIDPAVVQIARTERVFTHLHDCGSSCDVVLGDARLSLARQPHARYSLLVLDAFSSDGIPVHLLTTEALELYLERLAPDGVLAFHISNRHLRLRPVLAAVAKQWGLTTLVQRDPTTVAAEGRYASEWMLMARSPEAFGPLVDDPRWTHPPVPAGTHVWTDDFSDVLGVLKTNWAAD
jgi:spermidine synthase